MGGVAEERVREIIRADVGMDWTTLLTAVGGMLTTLGGFEFVKWVAARKSHKRVTEAAADSSEFGVLSQVNTFLQEQLLRKEERFAEQTSLVRTLTTENLELTRKVVMLETERSMKLCERRGCADRQPQSHY